MKVKKVLSLVLALVLVLTMIPAQLILSAGLGTTTLSDSTTNIVDVTIAKTASNSNYVGLIDLALKIKIDYSQISDDANKALVAFDQAVTIDPSVVSTVGAKTRNPKTIGVPNMEAMIEQIKASDGRFITKSADWAFVDVKVPLWDEPEADEDYASFVTAASTLSCNSDASKVFIQFNGYCVDPVMHNEQDNPEFLVAHVYLKPQEGKTLADVKNAIHLTTNEEVTNEAPAILEGVTNYISNKAEGAGTVGEAKIQFSDEFNPVAAEYTITFTGIKNADGSDADDVVKTVTEGEDVEAPALSGYEGADYNYSFAGWDKDIVSPATGDATYTAQYTKLANDKTALQKEVDEDVALNEADYTAETWAPFAAKLAAAQAVLANDNATKGEIETALDELVAARRALEPKVEVYEITFKWITDAGNQEQTVQVTENTVPTAPEGSEAGYEDATKTYTFAGWTPEIVAATGDTTYTATYREAAKTAQITFNYKTVDGAKSYGVTANYGTNAEDLLPADATSYNSADGSYTYTLTGWTPALGTVTGDQTYTAQYSTTENPANYDAVDAAIAAANEIIGADGYEQKYTADSRDALANAINDVVRGKLAGDQTAVDAMAAAINQAISELSVQNYNITVITHDGSDTTAYPYGTTLDLGTPDEYDDGDYHYTFSSWTPAVETVTADATYTAQYNSAFVPADTTALEAAISAATAKRNNGTEWTSDSVAALDAAISSASAYIDTPAPAGRTQQAAIDAAKAAVDAAAANLAPDTPVTTYTITFVDWDGTQLKSETYNENAVVTGPADPTRADSADGNTSYTFTGWKTEGDTNVYPANNIPNATASVTYTAQYEETTNYADLTALNAAITAAETKQAEDNFNAKYANAPEFNRLVQAAKDLVASNPLKSEQGNVDTAADNLNNFTLTLNTYTITFSAHEGNTERVVNYGETPVAPEAGDYSEGDYDYTFKDWGEDIVPATADKTYTAAYNATFVPADYSANATAAAAAKDIVDNQESNSKYTPASLQALKDALDANVAEGLGRTSQAAVDSATAAINDALNGLALEVYTIKFVSEGATVSEQALNYGATVVIPADPTKPADETYTYAFASWSPDVEATVTGNATYNAQFTSTYKEYTIKFMVEGNEYAKYTLHYGDTVNVPEEPTKDADLANTYDFDYWTPAVSDVTGDATYTAVFVTTPIDYTISFYDAEGNEIAAQTYHYGDTIVPPTAPQKAADNYNTYAFAGWDPAVPATVDGTGTGIYTATYTATPIDYTVKFLDEGGAEISSATYHYGDTVVVPADPTKASSAAEDFAFAGWTPAVVTTVAGNATYTATYSSTPRMYTITATYKDIDGREKTDTMQVAYGATPDLGTPATVIDGTTKYTFDRWTPDVTAVDGDADYTAQYTESQVTNPTYTINFKYADSEDQAVSGNYADHNQTVEENTLPTAPTPADFTTATAKYEFTGWDATVAPATGDTTYRAQYNVTPITASYEINFRYAETTAQVQDGHLEDHIQTVDEGEMPIVPTPGSFTDGFTVYTFEGWDEDVVPATGDKVYTAIYNVTTTFIPDMSEIEALVERYNQMVKTGKYNKDDLKAVKAYIDDIYDIYDADGFESQDEVDEMAIQLRILEDACRKISTTRTTEKKTTKTTTRTSRSAATGDNATLVVMTVILVSSLGLAVISLKKKKNNI